MNFSIKGFFIFAFSLAMFNVGLALNNVEQDVITFSSLVISVTLGVYFMSGKIFEGEDETDA